MSPLGSASLLAGRLETADGQKLVPSHAVKQGKRYRYYIEQRLLQGEGIGTKGARYPAGEVEKAVLAILQRFLNSPSDIVTMLAIEDLTPGTMKRMVGQAKTLSGDLKDPQQARHIVSRVINKIIVHEDALELRLLTKNLAELLGAKSGSEDPIHVITSPCRLARRGQDLKFILPLLDDSNTFSRQDPALIQAVAKAHLWWRWIKGGEVKSLTEIAGREGIDKAQVTRWLRLAFLSPKLVRQIRAGAHPTSLTIETLTRQVDLPTNWQEQETLVAALA